MKSSLFYNIWQKALGIYDLRFTIYDLQSKVRHPAHGTTKAKPEPDTIMKTTRKDNQTRQGASSACVVPHAEGVPNQKFVIRNS